jgi:hypothetical protein
MHPIRASTLRLKFQRRAERSKAMEPAIVDMYDAAYLAGGPERTVDTAVVALLESGRIRAQRSGDLTVADPTPRNVVEGAVLDAIGKTHSLPLLLIRLRAGGDQRLAQIEESLRARGLISTSWWWRYLGFGRCVPSSAGRRLLEQLRANPSPITALASGSAALVALDGHEHMADPTLRDAVFGTSDREPVERSGWFGTGIGASSGNGWGGDGGGDGGGCGGSDGGSGGGCGGGGCGGGGCGGS